MSTQERIEEMMEEFFNTYEGRDIDGSPNWPNVSKEKVRTALTQLAQEVRGETILECDELARIMMREYANTPLTPPSLRGNAFDWLSKFRQRLSNPLTPPVPPNE